MDIDDPKNKIILIFNKGSWGFYKGDVKYIKSQI